VFHSPRALPTPKEDCILSAYNIALTAELLGMGSCFVSLAQQAISTSGPCKDAIGIPRADVAHAVLILGYPKRPFLRPAPRPEVDIRIA